MKNLLAVIVIAIAVVLAGFFWLNENTEPAEKENLIKVFNPKPGQSIKTNAKTIKLFYYNPEKDKDVYGNIQCSREGLEPVERQIPATLTPIQDAIRLLLKGGLTDEERQRGVTSEYPLAGLELKSASLTNETLTLTFNDPQNKTGGGACRVGILWFQIESTAKQFNEVESVRFMPEELFQP